ncbi:DUF2085 domain-containing protein [Chloroflexota bacterium]
MEQKPVASEQISPRRFRLTVVVFAVSLVIILLFVAFPAQAPLDKADRVGYAICHRIPERSFYVNGRPLPLCARCTGTFLGAMLGLAAMLLLRRSRASHLPSVAILGVLVTFVGLWAFDGLNSYMTLFPGAPHLYEPQNWLRMTTGLLNGLALIFFVFPIFNFTLWREPTQERAIKNGWELVALLPVVALLVLAAQAGVDLVLYPLAIISSLGVVVLLAIINSMIAAVVLGREGYALSWSQAAVPLVVGTAMALVEITAMVLLRDYLTAAVGLPF